MHVKVDCTLITCSSYDACAHSAAPSMHLEVSLTTLLTAAHFSLSHAALSNVTIANKLHCSRFTFYLQSTGGDDAASFC